MNAHKITTNTMTQDIPTVEEIIALAKRSIVPKHLQHIPLSDDEWSQEDFDKLPDFLKGKMYDTDEYKKKFDTVLRLYQPFTR